MMYRETTQVPNALFDKHLPHLNASEFKVFLTIIRQTYGWIDLRTGKRKTRDRISHGQFMQKTHLSRRMVSKTLNLLFSKGLIAVTDKCGKPLSASERSGRTHLYYSPTCAQNGTDLCTFEHKPVHQSAHNKTNYTKITKTKLRRLGVKSVGEILKLKNVFLGENIGRHKRGMVKPYHPIPCFPAL
jgi:hypothetical protein